MEIVKAVKTKAVLGLGIAVALALMAAVIWAVLIFVLQVIGWIQHAVWQPVPLGALWLAEGGQQWLRVDHDVKNALTLVPSWGDADSHHALVQSLAGSAAGLALIVAWILDTPLVVWILAAVFGLIYTVQDYAENR